MYWTLIFMQNFKNKSWANGFSYNFSVINRNNWHNHRRRWLFQWYNRSVYSKKHGLIFLLFRPDLRNFILSNDYDQLNLVPRVVCSAYEVVFVIKYNNTKCVWFHSYTCWYNNQNHRQNHRRRLLCRWYNGSECIWTRSNGLSVTGRGEIFML